MDWIAAGIDACGGLTLVGFGWFDPHALHVSRPMGYVAIVLGLVAMRLALADLTMYWRKPKEKMFWWYSHLGNVYRQLYRGVDGVQRGDAAAACCRTRWIVLWLWPITVGVPAIVLTTAYYKRKFAPKRPVAGCRESQ